MPRLIDADALDKTVQRLNEMGWGITRDDYKRIDRVLFEMPTIDAVEVVRCKDCKWWKSKYMRLGERKVCVIEAYEPVRNEDEYCSWAERREDETD